MESIDILPIMRYNVSTDFITQKENNYGTIRQVR